MQPPRMLLLMFSLAGLLARGAGVPDGDPGMRAGAPVPWEARIPAELPPGGPREGLQPLGRSLQYYVQLLEQWVGREVPDAIVHTAPLAYTCRKPLYDGEGRALLDGKGRPLTTLVAQTGRMFFPSVTSSRDLPLVVFSHATSLQKQAVPSNYMGAEWILGAAAAAYYGFAVAMPDLPGMGGDTTQYHPYCHATSLAYAVVDAIPAAQRVFEADDGVRERGFRWNGRLYLMGYSSGGFATMAAVREIEAHPREYRESHHFTLAGSACMAGPFDLSGAMRAKLLDPERVYPMSYFIPHLVLGFHEVYGRAVEPRDILAPLLLERREDGDVLEWAGGHMDAMDALLHIGDRLGVSPTKVNLRSMLNPAWVDRELSEPGYRTSLLRRFLEENDVYRGWTPTRPMLLADFPNDDCVPNACTVKALEALGGAIRGAGGDPRDLLVVRRIRVPDLGITHITGALVAISTAFQWIYEGMPRGREPLPEASGDAGIGDAQLWTPGASLPIRSTYSR